MKKFLLIFLLFIYILTGVAFAKESALCDKYIRLHIIANSNSGYDQATKEMVKEFFLTKHKDKLTRFNSKEESLYYIKENKELIEKEINDYLYKRNTGYTCHIEISKKKYDKSFYESIYLPKGEYDSVRIFLGKGEGKNLFFIMFPSQIIKENITVKNSNNEKIVYKSKIAEFFGI